MSPLRDKVLQHRHKIQRGRHRQFVDVQLIEVDAVERPWWIPADPILDVLDMLTGWCARGSAL
jgi:hypothetical protein